MPLDGHSYLVNQGWRAGKGLREGAIAKPLTIPQKKNLAGLGKDRDEAFPFWDHLFTAASKSIQIKCLSDGEDDLEDCSNNDILLKRTSTGILSNRRPVEGTPATSGSTTPNADHGLERPNLISTAKRDAAKRGLYSRFFRGPVLGPESITEEEQRLTSLLTQTPGGDDVINNLVAKNIPEPMMMEVKVIGRSMKRRELKKDSDEGAGNGGEEARRQRKRRRKEDKEKGKKVGRKRRQMEEE